MKKILVTGALGQIGSELTLKLRNLYGIDNVISTDIRKLDNEITNNGLYEIVDVTNENQLLQVAKKYEVDTIIHLAAVLSAAGEKNPKRTWDLNMGSVVNCLEICRHMNLKLFIPSSIAVFGNKTPKDNTNQNTILNPNTMYGVSKASGELISDYYYNKYGVDVRGLRFPGLISYLTKPGGGTTDYAVDIYYKAIEEKKYKCYLSEKIYMDMMYMPDALNAIVQLMEADKHKLINRNSYNVSSMSFSPKEIYNEIKKHIKDFEIEYETDPIRENIAKSWPNSIDSSSAVLEWGFKYEYDLEKMTIDMLEKLKGKGIY